MLITALAVIVAWSSSAPFSMADARLYDETYMSPRFKGDDGMTDYFYKYRVHMEEEPEDYEIVRTVRTRPESPAASFTMKEMRVSVFDNPANSRSFNQLQFTAQGQGVEKNAKSNFFNTLRTVINRSVESVDPRPMTINPNEGVRPGGWTVRKYGYDIYYTDVHAQLYRVGADGSETPVGSEQIIDLFEYWIPVPLIDEKFYPDPVYGMDNFSLDNGFGGVRFGDETAESLGLGGVYLPRLETKLRSMDTKGFTTSASTYRNDVLRTLPKRYGNFSDLVKLSPRQVDDALNAVAGQGTSMNSLNVPGDIRMTSNYTCGSELSMPAGTIWVPDKADYQSMMSTTPMRTTFPTWASTTMPANVVANGRTHCLNKNLKEPAEGVRYFPYMGNDDVLSGLAELTEASNFRGPWDQVRTWIYTDKVGLKEANDRISPPVTEGQYLNGLYDVFRLGGLEDKDVDDTKIFAPTLLISSFTNDDAFAWYAMSVCERHGKAVRAWLESRPDDLLSMVKSPRDDYQAAHPARLLAAVLSSRDKDARLGALNYLDRTSGIESVLKGKIGNLFMSLYSEDQKETDLATRVASRFVEN